MTCRERRNSLTTRTTIPSTSQHPPTTTLQPENQTTLPNTVINFSHTGRSGKNYYTTKPKTVVIVSVIATIALSVAVVTAGYLARRVKRRRIRDRNARNSQINRRSRQPVSETVFAITENQRFASRATSDDQVLDGARPVRPPSYRETIAISSNLSYIKPNPPPSYRETSIASNLRETMSTDPPSYGGALDTLRPRDAISDRPPSYHTAINS